MMVHFDPKAEELRHLQVGPLGPHVKSCAALLSRQGYCPENGWQKIRLVADFSRGRRVVAAEMRAIELDALHRGIGCGLGAA